MYNNTILRLASIGTTPQTPVKRVNEHSKYRQHRTAQPHEWLTMPLIRTSSKPEARRVEKHLIKVLKSNLNTESETPFWLLKGTCTHAQKRSIQYAKIYKASLLGLLNKA